MTDPHAEAALHAISQESPKLDALIQAMIDIYGEPLPNGARSVDRYAAIRDFTFVVIQLIAPDANREAITDQVRQSIKVGVRRLSSQLAIMQKGGTA